MPESKTYYPSSLREEELKNRVAHDWFGAFDCARIIGNIDFCVDVPATELDLGYAAEPMLWAEAKAGNRKDIVASFVQLILTIGGEHAADKNLPPHFLGAFDAEKTSLARTTSTGRLRRATTSPRSSRNSTISQKASLNAKS